MEDPDPSSADPNMPKELRRWESIRSKGKARFILLTGVLAWGLPMFLLMTFVVSRKSWRERTTEEIAATAVLWTLGGAGFGWWVWRSSEKKYWNYIESREELDE